jgi:hypothetical protein
MISLDIRVEFCVIHSDHSHIGLIMKRSNG